MTENQAKAALDELESLSRPLVEYLRKKHHPHTAIVVTDERAVLVEEMLGVPFTFAETGQTGA